MWNRHYTSITNKFAVAKSWKCNLKKGVCCFWQSTSTHTETTLSVDIPMIKFLDDSGSTNYCLCAVLVSCTVFFLGKKLRIYVFGKKDMQHIMPTSCYLRSVFSYLRNSICLMVVTWTPEKFMIWQLFTYSCAYLTSGPALFNCYRPLATLNPALVCRLLSNPQICSFLSLDISWASLVHNTVQKVLLVT